MDVGGIRRGHHAPLHVGDAAVREQDDDIDLVAAAEGLDGGAAGVARGGDDNGAAFAARRQRMVHQPRQKLHGHVFEGQRRPVKELERKRIHPELRQRDHRRMAEGAVGLACHAGEIGVGDRITGEQPDHLQRHLGIGPAGEAGYGAGIDLRPGVRHIKSAVAGEAREHDFGEAERGGFTPCGHVTQTTSFLTRREPAGDISY